MRTPLTPAHAKALTILLLAIRPDWSKDYTHDAVARMRETDDDLERIVRVAVRGALSPAIAKPDVLPMGGEHWKARADESPEPVAGTGSKATRCDRCHTIHTPQSPCVSGGQLADLAQRIAAARQAVAGKKPNTRPGKVRS
jgi:hypothetical protein